MTPTPKDMLNYVLENKKESDFLTSIQLHKSGYSIGEIADKRFKEKDGVYKFISNDYKINVEIDDENIITAIHNGLYITPFISRKDEEYQVHFLVHIYPESMKSQFEEEIARDVIEYMILKTIVALRLDSKSKIDAYLR